MAVMPLQMTRDGGDAADALTKCRGKKAARLEKETKRVQEMARGKGDWQDEWECPHCFGRNFLETRNCRQPHCHREKPSNAREILYSEAWKHRIGFAAHHPKTEDAYFRIENIHTKRRRHSHNDDISQRRPLLHPTNDLQLFPPYIGETVKEEASSHLSMYRSELKEINPICELAQCSGLPKASLDTFRLHRKDREENFASAENEASITPSSIPQLRARAHSTKNAASEAILAKEKATEAVRAAKLCEQEAKDLAATAEETVKVAEHMVSIQTMGEDTQLLEAVRVFVGKLKPGSLNEVHRATLMALHGVSKTLRD